MKLDTYSDILEELSKVEINIIKDELEDLIINVLKEKEDFKIDKEYTVKISRLLKSAHYSEVLIQETESSYVIYKEILTNIGFKHSISLSEQALLEKIYFLKEKMLWNDTFTKEFTI